MTVQRNLPEQARQSRSQGGLAYRNSGHLFPVCTSEYSGLLTARAMALEEQTFFLSHSKIIATNAAKRQVRGICFAGPDLEALGSPHLSASASAVAITIDVF